MQPFNVIIEDNGQFKPYDIMIRLCNEYNYLKKQNPKNRWKKLPENDEEFKEFVIDISRYNWWGKCEYEIILQDWPCGHREEKWDIFKQIMMNIDLITRIFIENVND